jgi:hypothetical protein
MGTYYITPIIGAGTRADPFRTAMSNYGVSNVTVLPTGSDGRPHSTWALVAIPDGTVTTAIDADPTFDKIPITSLDVPISSLTQAQRSALQAIGTKYGITKIAGLKNSDTCRTALTDIGQQLDPNFDPNQFSVL